MKKQAYLKKVEKKRHLINKSVVKRIFRKKIKNKKTRLFFEN